MIFIHPNTSVTILAQNHCNMINATLGALWAQAHPEITQRSLRDHPRSNQRSLKRTLKSKDTNFTDGVYPRLQMCYH